MPCSIPPSRFKLPTNTSPYNPAMRDRVGHTTSEAVALLLIQPLWETLYKETE